VLLDECVDRRLAGDIQGHDVKTVPEVGWAGFKSGELVFRAERPFDVFVTVDRNLPFQQDSRACQSRSSCCELDPAALSICAP